MAANHYSQTDKQLEAIGLKRCPLNRNHIIRMSRFQRHVTDCLNQMNTSDRNKWEVCPFNAGHCISRETMQTHLFGCTDNRPYIREQYWTLQSICEEVANTAIKEEKANYETNTGPWIDFTAQIKVETNEEVVKQDIKPTLNVSKTECDDWNNSNVEEYSIYQKPLATTAKEFIDDDKYLFDNKGLIDPISYSRLSQKERKQFQEMQVQRQREEAARPPISKHVNPYLNCHPIMKVVEQNENSAKHEFCNPLLEILRKRAQNKPMIKGLTHEIEEPNTSPPALIDPSSLHYKLHSIDIIDNPINYQKIVMSETENRKNEGSAVAMALRKVDLTHNRDKNMDLMLVREVPFRMPQTNPFVEPLRKPHTIRIKSELKIE